MTAQNQWKQIQGDTLEELITDGTGRELKEFYNKEQVASLIEKGVYTPTAADAKKSGPITGPKTKKALEKIPVPEEHLTKTAVDKIEALKVIYKDLINNRTSKKMEYWPADLWWFSKKILRYKIRIKDNFFFAWLLIHSADLDKEKCKKSIKNNWRITCTLMELITGKNEFLKFYDHKEKRKDFYRIISKYVNILLGAGLFKHRILAHHKRIKKINDVIDRFFLTYSKAATRLEIEYGYDLNLTLRIHAFLVKRNQASENPIRMGVLYDHFSNIRKKDIFPCLLFLERNKEILGDMTNKKIYYIGDGKNLKEIVPTVFPDFFKSELSSSPSSHQ